MKTEIINTILLSTAFLGLFGLAELLYHYGKVKVEWTRKLVHIGGGLTTLLFPLLLDNHWLVLLLCASFVLILATSLKFGLLPSINAIDRKSVGSLVFPAAVYGCYIANDLFQQQASGMAESNLFFYLPILTLAISDPLAAFVGKRWPYGKYGISGGVKTVSGSLAFLISALLIACGGLYAQVAWLSVAQIMSFGIMTALAATIAEAFTGKGWDNITIPGTVILCLLLVERFTRLSNIIVAST